MRAYFFGNMYLSSIQQGIQAGHVIGDMFVKYMPPHPEFNEASDDQIKLAAVREWALNHKTMILLNAGYGENIHSLNRLFSSEQNMFPHAMFCEEKASLDGAATSVGIIVPDYIYIGAAQLRGNDEQDIIVIKDGGEVRWFDEPHHQICVPITLWEYSLMKEMNKYGMAS